jgi:hypothetical protein
MKQWNVAAEWHACMHVCMSACVGACVRVHVCMYLLRICEVPDSNLGPETGNHY